MTESSDESATLTQAQPPTFEQAAEWQAHVDEGDEVRLKVDIPEPLRGTESYTGRVREIERRDGVTTYHVHGWDQFEVGMGEMDRHRVDYRFGLSTERQQHDNVIVKRRIDDPKRPTEWHEQGHLIGAGVMLTFYNGGESR